MRDAGRAGWWTLLLAGGMGLAHAGAEPIHPLAQSPALGANSIAFRYADDVWEVPRTGGEARRLTATGNVKEGPFFSPDGRYLAYTAEYDRNADVYVIPAEGGVAKRLTWHPGADEVVGWTPDSSAVVFRSPRMSRRDITRLFRVSVEGRGLPEPLPMQSSDAGAISPDGKRVAYVPFGQWQRAWKRYRGGQTTPIWIADLKTLELEKVPRENSNDSSPTWAGETLYFLSDRNGPVSLFRYDASAKRVEQVVENHGLDFKSAAAGPGGVVYAQFGDVHLYDVNAHAEHPVAITISNDLPELRPHLIKLDVKQIANVALSPSGERLAVEARGDVYTIPHDKGDVRNLTHSADAADRDPGWSPDGRWIAYFSDRSGEYALYLEDQSGLGAVRKIELGTPSFFYGPVWSPDSKHIAYTDKRLNVWMVNVEGGGAPAKVDTDLFETPNDTLQPRWSPDSQWLVYAKSLPSHLHAAYVYSLATGKARQLTDGMSDVLHAAFDKGGKYLYFTASTNAGPSEAWLDLSAANRPVSSSVYVAVLQATEPSPLKPESDEEKVGGEADKDKEKDKDKGTGDSAKPANDTKRGKPGDEKASDADKDQGKNQDKAKDKDKKPAQVKIDFEGLQQRILALPMPEKHYLQLEPGKEGVLYAAEGGPEANPVSGSEDETLTLHRLKLSDRKEEEVLHGIAGFTVSANGEKLAYQEKDDWKLAGADELKPGENAPGKPFKFASLEVMTDPRTEWKQMYNEVWRMERDFFYDPHFHGLDLEKTKAAYAPFLQRIGSRDELDFLFEEMLGNLTVGHEFIAGPDGPEPQVAGTGLLGADYRIAGDRYQFTKIFNGENWNPKLHAPLTEPGVSVHEGEYLLAVDGRELHANDNLYSFFEGRAGKQTVLRVGAKPDGAGARDVTVVPVDNEQQLRTYAWVEDNRRAVDKATNGRVAYVYLPDTASGGYTYFNRYFYAQVGRQAAILDERFNHGGEIADYIIDALRRPVQAFDISRQGEDESEPVGAIFGPKVMIINQSAGSGGDAMPWLFRKEGVGKLVGTRTWGGLVGIYGYPVLLDGGRVTAPRVGIYGTNGKFEVENQGIPPDIAVEMTPREEQGGHDPQLERAIEEVEQEMKEHPAPAYPKPEFPSYKGTQ